MQTVRTIPFLKSKTDRVSVLLTPENYWAMVTSPEVVSLCDRIAAESDDERKQQLKGQLKAVIWMAQCNEDGRRPTKQTAVPNGLCFHDWDHLKEAPEVIYHHQIEPNLERLGIALVKVSARREGLHLVSLIPEGWTPEQTQIWVAEECGMSEYRDKAVTDLSRLCYVSSGAMHLYYDPSRLFSKGSAFQVPAGVMPKLPAAPTVQPATQILASSQSAPQEATEIPWTTYKAEAKFLKAFDLCVKEANLANVPLDKEGDYNWHTNLMAILSVGLTKLMPRQQLMAVVAEKLPNYAKTADCRALIDYFYEHYQSEMGYMSPRLRAINAEIQKNDNDDENENENENENHNHDDDDDNLIDNLMKGWNPPMPPKKLMRLILLLIKPFPQQYHPMLIVVALVLLGVIGSHYRATYIDGRIIAANLYAAFAAGSGQGKSWVTVLTKIMCQNTLTAWDNAEWRKLAENQEMREKKKNAKECPTKYHPRFRIMETMSKTSLLEVQSNLGENGMVLCKYSEADELASASRQAFSNLSVLLRKAWDMDEHRQFYMSEASCNTQCVLNAAILLTGTPRAVLSRLFSDTENGMMQRFIPVILPRVKRTFRPPVFTPLSADEEAERDALLSKLWQQDLSLGDDTLMLELPRTRRLIEEWYDELEERYNDGEITEAEADLSHRVGQFMMRAAIPFVALYGEESREMLDLIRWLGDFSYYNICYLFGKRVTDDMRESDEMLTPPNDGRKTAEPLLSMLPEYFSKKEITELRVRLGQSPDVHMLLSRYCKNKKIEKVGKGMYRKCNI